MFACGGQEVSLWRTDPTNAIDEFTAVNREHWMRTLVNPL